MVIEPLDSASENVGNPFVEPTQPKKSQSPTEEGGDGVTLGPPVVVPEIPLGPPVDPPVVLEGPPDELPEVVEVKRVLDATEGPVMLAPVDDEVLLEPWPEVEDAETVAGPVEMELVSVTGQIVVEIGTVTVVRMVERAGQFVTVGAQLIMVETLVV